MAKVTAQTIPTGNTVCPVLGPSGGTSSTHPHVGTRQVLHVDTEPCVWATT